MKEIDELAEKLGLKRNKGESDENLHWRYGYAQGMKEAVRIRRLLILSYIGFMNEIKQAERERILALIEEMKENNICTCERRVCHCGKFSTAKETNAFNTALSDLKAAINNNQEGK